VAPFRIARLERAPAGGLAIPSTLALPDLVDAPVRNVVLLIGDGMGLAQISAARLRAFGAGGSFLWERFPVLGLVDTRPAEGLVTKSEAAATAFATGTKTRNGRIGIDDEGRRLTSLLEQARDAGWATGVLTSSDVVDATPAAFYAHAEHRHEEATIALQLAAAGFDFVAGGGREWFTPRAADGRRRDGRDLLTEARARGVDVVTDPGRFAGAEKLPLWALFPGDTLGEKPPHPTVGEMTARALTLLTRESARRETGFLLVAEEEGIDTAGHARSLEQLAGAALRLDGAVEEAVRFAAADGHTLVLVFGDHATGALAIDPRSTASELVVEWGSDGHDGESVPLFAFGPPSAARRFAGSFDNTGIARRLRELLALPEPSEGTG